MTASRDCYLTPFWIVDLCNLLWDDIDLDPFHHPKSVVGARRVIDERIGGDAYRDGWVGRSALVNGPYSGSYSEETAKRCVSQRLSTGIESVNICPAAPGSVYWKRWIWPHAAGIAWLGRVAFVPGEDIMEDGVVVHSAGSKAKGGNRTEIAAVYLGADGARFARCFSRRAVVSRRK